MSAVAIGAAGWTTANAATEAVPRRPAARVEPVVQWDHDWLDGAVFYEVFVRSFADSDGDGIGDLRGLIERLDYLNDGDPATTTDLGVTGLWLMPIFDSPSYHGYDVADYEAIEPDYGSLADFEDLVREAEARGIRIILDLVLNHSSSQHPWFVDAATGPGSPLRSRYVWRTADPGWTQPWGGSSPTWHFNPVDGSFYYGIFWGGMPDLDYRDPATRAEAFRLARLWLDRGAAGFRLDAARYIVEDGAGQLQQDTPETHAFWRDFSRAIRRVRPDAMVVGEAWGPTSVIAGYFGSSAVVEGGDELPSCFDFPLSDAIIDGLRTSSSAPLEAVLASMAALYPAGVRDAPFLTNHDQIRLATQLGGATGRLRSAASILLTLPGVPFLYYGEEVGLANGTGGGDEAKRTPMPWSDGPGGGFTTATPWYPFAPGRATANVASQTVRDDSLLSHYRRLVRVRQASPALAGGTLTVPAHSSSGVLVLERDLGDDHVLVVVNLTGGFTVAGGIAVDRRPVTELYRDGAPGSVSGGPGSWSFVLAPWGTTIWQLR